MFFYLSISSKRDMSRIVVSVKLFPVPFFNFCEKT
jgi:hypothetical protein